MTVNEQSCELRWQLWIISDQAYWTNLLSSFGTGGGSSTTIIRHTQLSPKHIDISTQLDTTPFSYFFPLIHPYITEEEEIQYSQTLLSPCLSWIENLVGAWSPPGSDLLRLTWNQSVFWTIKSSKWQQSQQFGKHLKYW